MKKISLIIALFAGLTTSVSAQYANRVAVQNDDNTSKILKSIENAFVNQSFELIEQELFIADTATKEGKKIISAQYVSFDLVLKDFFLNKLYDSHKSKTYILYGQKDIVVKIHTDKEIYVSLRIQSDSTPWKEYDFTIIYANGDIRRISIEGYQPSKVVSGGSFSGTGRENCACSTHGILYQRYVGMNKMQFTPSYSELDKAMKHLW